MGVLAAPRRRSPWAQDPEALVIFTLEVARDDPRLFDEVLDWLVVNETLLSVRRLRSMCRGSEDRRLLDATLGWVAQFRPRARLKPRVEHPSDTDLLPLFRELSTPARSNDPAFAAAGLLRPVATPSGKAGHPDLRAPINLIFRLRQLLGVSARAEIMRFLLTIEAPVANVQVITRSAGFAKRNVHQALMALHASGAVSLTTAAGEQRFAINSEPWTQLLEIDPGELPTHRDWPQLLGGLRTVYRWLHRPELEDLSDYMLASHARDLLEQVRADFEYAGIPVGHAPAAGAWQDLEVLIDRGLHPLDVARDLRPPPPPDSVPHPTPARESAQAEIP